MNREKNSLHKYKTFMLKCKKSSAKVLVSPFNRNHLIDWGLSPNFQINPPPQVTSWLRHWLNTRTHFHSHRALLPTHSHKLAHRSKWAMGLRCWFSVRGCQHSCAPFTIFTSRRWSIVDWATEFSPAAAAAAAGAVSAFCPIRWLVRLCPEAHPPDYKPPLTSIPTILPSAHPPR